MSCFSKVVKVFLLRKDKNRWNY